MGKHRIRLFAGNKRTTRLRAYSILEVVVSTLLILVASSIFSYLLLQVTRALSIVSETQVMYSLSQYEIRVDTNMIKKKCSACTVISNVLSDDTTLKDKIVVLNSNSGKKILVYQIVNSTTTNSILY